MKKRTLVILLCVLSLVALCIVFASCGKEKSCADGGTKHNWGKWEETKATCGEPSAKFRECNDCGEIEENQNYTPKPATGLHRYIDYVCVDCGTVSPNKPNCEPGGEGTVHDFEIISETAAKCGIPGFRNSKCRVCNKTKTEEIEEALEHRWGSTIMGILQFERTCELCDTTQIRELNNISGTATVEVEGGGWPQAGAVNNGNWGAENSSSGSAFSGVGAHILTLSSPQKIDQIAIAVSGGSYTVEVITNKSGGEYKSLGVGAGYGNDKEKAVTFDVASILGDPDELILVVKVSQTTSAVGTILWGEIALGQVSDTNPWQTVKKDK